MGARCAYRLLEAFALPLRGVDERPRDLRYETGRALGPTDLLFWGGGAHFWTRVSASDSSALLRRAAYSLRSLLVGP